MQRKQPIKSTCSLFYYWPNPRKQNENIRKKINTFLSVCTGLSLSRECSGSDSIILLLFITAEGLWLPSLNSHSVSLQPETLIFIKTVSCHISSHCIQTLEHYLRLSPLPRLFLSDNFRKYHHFDLFPLLHHSDCIWIFTAFLKNISTFLPSNTVYT